MAEAERDIRRAWVRWCSQRNAALHHAPDKDDSNAMVREFSDFLLGLHERLELPPRCPDDIEESSLPSIREKIREEESAEKE